MTTVADLIAHLQTLPQDLIVQCLEEKNTHHNVWTTWKGLEIENDVYRCGQYLEIGCK